MRSTTRLDDQFIMPSQSKLAGFDARVSAFLNARFAGSCWTFHEYQSLWRTYLELELPNEDFVAEFTSGKESSIHQRVWEMQLARLLHDQGHQLTCLGDGPDLRFDHAGTTYWVEAVCPEPKGIPPEWLSPDINVVKRLPHEAMLLRWTAAFADKHAKLCRYIDRGKVNSDQGYIIAINGSMLSSFPVDTGITQMPFGVETVFPVGPLVYRWSEKNEKLEAAEVSIRPFLINKNAAQIPTTSFINPKYSGVSAILGSARTHRWGKPLPVHVAHNPLANVPVPTNILGAAGEEWVATLTATRDEYDLAKVG